MRLLLVREGGFQVSEQGKWILCPHQALEVVLQAAHDAAYLKKGQKSAGFVEVALSSPPGARELLIEFLVRFPGQKGLVHEQLLAGHLFSYKM